MNTTSPFFVDEFSEQIWRTKYAGEFDTPEEFYGSLAGRIALGDPALTEKFYDLMINRKFSPGGRTLAWNGRQDARMSLMNCTTHAIEGDTLEDIIQDTAYVVARASSRGQGIGIDISALRPAGAPVGNAARTSTGAISFMEMLNAIGGVIGQEGRRAALLFSINDHHPDLYRPFDKAATCPRCNGIGCYACVDGYIPYDFLHVKRHPGKVENANISVRVSDEFMRAVENNQMWNLYFDGESSGGKFSTSMEVPARELFMALAGSAWASAEPGILYWDTSRRMSNSDLFGYPIVGVNGCTEEVLDQDGVCNLSSMNLAAYVREPFTDDAWFDFSAFEDDVRTVVTFLDNVVTIELRNDSSTNGNQWESLYNLRRVGLGVMGLADMLAMLGLRYGDSIETIDCINNVFYSLMVAAYQRSTTLALAYGPAPAWNNVANYEDVLDQGFFPMLPDDLKSLIAEVGTRNITVLAIAPTGSISNLFGVSSGIEPLFAHSYVRRHRLNGSDEFIDYVHPAVQRAREMGLDDSLWPTAYEVSVHEHIAVQASVQKYIDASVSKTLNCPHDATVDDVAQAYMLAWKMGLKGLAIYRDGSRSEQVLMVKATPIGEETQLFGIGGGGFAESNEPLCPECHGSVVVESGCIHCPSCGWALCAV